MSDKSKVLNIALSDGGCLKVNRDNIGDLSACVGMLSPEDLNLIMRAIAQDTKAQEMLLEKEDMEGVPLKGPPGGRGVNYEKKYMAKLVKTYLDREFVQTVSA